MKKAFFIAVTAVICNSAVSQNVGIGTTNPSNRLDVIGNMMVNEPLAYSNSQPTAAQTKTMINGTNVQFAITDSVFRLYDPSGPSSNYIDNMNATATTYDPYPGGPGFTIGYEMIIEEIDLKAGDSLIITEWANGLRLLSIGNNYNTPGIHIFNTEGLNIRFKSNIDGINGSGIKILFKRYYKGASQPVKGFAGQAFLFDAQKGSLQGGRIHPTPVGINAVALGNYCTAGNYSVAMGNNSKASSGGTAIGDFAVATGEYSVALGSSEATGYSGVAIGRRSHAIGNDGVAIGDNNYAYGHASVAVGNFSYALGEASVAMNAWGNAGGNYSAALGYSTMSPSYACVSLGRYNFSSPTSGTAWVNTDPVLIVGNGSSSSFRSNILEFYKNGNLTIWGTLTQFSDARLKRNILPLSHSLQKIKQLNGYTFNWKNESVDQSTQTGLIAQEVQQVFPELVNTNLKGDLTVNYNGLIPHLLESIKELNKRIEKLETELGKRK